MYYTTAASCRLGNWSECGARVRPSTGCTTSTALPTPLRAGSSSRASRLPATLWFPIRRWFRRSVCKAVPVAQYYGKYRGTVLNNVDPMQMGRIQVVVPDVTSVLPTTWALPCVPMAGPQCGEFTVPPIGAAVWVEFEHGDRDYPIWIGGFWGSAAEVPALALA